MPLISPTAELRHLRHETEVLGKGDGVLKAAQGEVKALLKEQFAQGIGPDGTPLQETVRGKAALVSRKLANAFVSRIDRGVLRFVAKSKRDLLTAHNEGVTFAARSVEANQRFLTYDKNGKLIKNSKALNKKGEVRRGAFQRFAGAHTVGQRVLPQRPIIPDAELPTRYENAIDKAVTAYVEGWAEKAAK